VLGYHKLGDVIRERIDEVHRKLNRGSFFVEGMGANRLTLQRAELTLDRLSETNAEIVVKSITGALSAAREVRIGQARKAYA
jgi:hypothetical protein